MTKTKQLLSQLPSPDKELALGYFNENFFADHHDKEVPVTTIAGALCCSFRWADTKEGYDYWWDLTQKIR